MFDSHPGVLYRHEPDASHPCYEFPFFVELEDMETHSNVAAGYLNELRDVRTTRAVGRRPTFPKDFRKRGAALFHSTLVWLFLLVGRIPLIGKFADRVSIPDFVAADKRPVHVLKSVVSLCRAGLFARVLDQGYVVFIIRHPCGVIASQLRGVMLGKLEQSTPMNTLSGSEAGKRYGLTVDRMLSMTEDERLAWTWVVMNEQALRGLQEQNNTIVVTHEALCVDPVEECRRLFEFCGLQWHPQTEAFINAANSSSRAPSYYDVNRNSANEVEKWRKELAPDVIQRIEGILAQSPLAEFFK